MFRGRYNNYQPRNGLSPENTAIYQQYQQYQMFLQQKEELERERELKLERERELELERERERELELEREREREIRITEDIVEPLLQEDQDFLDFLEFKKSKKKSHNNKEEVEDEEVVEDDEEDEEVEDDLNIHNMSTDIRKILNNDSIKYTIKNEQFDYRNILKEGDINIKKGDLYLHDISCSGDGPYVICLFI